MLKVHKFALLMVPNLSPYKFCPSRPYFMLRLTTLMVLNLQMRGRFRKRVSKNIWHDGFKHCINWSCYRE